MGVPGAASASISFFWSIGMDSMVMKVFDIQK